jgi:hypothetical protein
MPTNMDDKIDGSAEIPSDATAKQSALTQHDSLSSRDMTDKDVEARRENVASEEKVPSYYVRYHGKHIVRAIIAALFTG